MPGVIALLPEPFKSTVETLWGEMHERFGVPIGYSGAVPHMTLHLGARDVEPGACAVVERVSRATAPFTMVTSGIGVFGGPAPVLYVNVSRSPRIAALADTLAVQLLAAGYPSTDQYFSSELWIPHITIAHGNLRGIPLGPVLEWLVTQDLAWEIPIGSIAVAQETATGADILSTFPLLG